MPSGGGPAKVTVGENGDAAAVVPHPRPRGCRTSPARRRSQWRKCWWSAAAVALARSNVPKASPSQVHPPDRRQGVRPPNRLPGGRCQRPAWHLPGSDGAIPLGQQRKPRGDPRPAADRDASGRIPHAKIARPNCQEGRAGHGHVGRNAICGYANAHAFT